MPQLNDLSGKTCLITGATQGIGLATALGLAQLNADLVLVGRDRARGDAAMEAVKKAGGRGSVELLLADLSSQASVRELAEQFRARHKRLDRLINNAGAVFFERQVTVDGLEQTFALNHIAYFLLTSLLLDLLRASAPARVINISSAAHRMGRLRFDDLQREHAYSGWGAYGQSKLANILFTNELARRLEGSGVTANSLHPGGIASGFGRNNPGFSGFLFRLGAPFLIGPTKGAATTIYLAASPQVEGVSGKYFARSREAHTTQAAQEVGTARRLWEVSEALVAPHMTAHARSG